MILCVESNGFFHFSFEVIPVAVCGENANEAALTLVTLDILELAMERNNKNSLGNLHCLSYRNNSATCALCNGDGTCGKGSCALPIPSKPMNANVSKQLEMVFVVDVGKEESKNFVYV